MNGGVAVTVGTLSSPQFEDDNDGKQISGRVGFTPTASFSIGVSAAQGEYLSDAGEDTDYGEVGSLPPPASYETHRQKALGLEYLRVVQQAFLVGVLGVYFVWQWMRGGQTLAMKAWRLRVVRADGTRLALRQALLRYVVALAGTLLVGVTFLWALVDREGAFLHDRIAGTRVVKT